jgi:hypothetical protein
MNKVEKDKLKHDFLNSIVIINSLTRSAASFLNTLSSNENTINQKQMEKFLHSMATIRAQTTKLEKYFQNLLDE